MHMIINLHVVITRSITKLVVDHHSILLEKYFSILWQQKRKQQKRK